MSTNTIAKRKVLTLPDLRSFILCIFPLTSFLLLQCSCTLRTPTVDKSTSKNEILCGQLQKRYTLFFLHFQKCGGTSVESSLKRFADRCNLGYARFPKGWRNEISRGKITFLTGHIFYGLHEKLPKGWSWDYVAVFRDPFDRAWSQFKHNGERRCKCSFLRFSQMYANYYQFKLTGSRSNKSVHRARAVTNLKKVKLVGKMDNLDLWYTALNDLLKSRSSSPLNLPPLQSFNVRNTSKSSGMEKLGSSYSQAQYDQIKDSNLYTEFGVMNRNDYSIFSELKVKYT
jgi:hypothetical protein